MKRLLALILIAVSGPCLAAGSSAFGPDTKQISVSTDCASPTKIMAYDTFLTRSIVVNLSSWTYLYISSVSTNMAPASTFFVPTGTSFSPDGIQSPFNGQIYACSSAATTQTNVPASVTAEVIRVR